jgi:hypothetical protein
VANAGWDRWTPVNAAAIGAHVIGSVGQLRANKERVARQQGRRRPGRRRCRLLGGRALRARETGPGGPRPLTGPDDPRTSTCRRIDWSTYREVTRSRATACVGRFPGA